MRLYREGLYAQIAIGDGNGSSLQRRGGFFGGTGMSGFTGTGIGGFGNVGGYFFGGGAGNFFSMGGSSGGGLVGGGAASVGGFIGMLQALQGIRNSEVDLDLKLQALGLLEAHLQAGTINLTQVDEFRQSIGTQRAQLLQARNSMESYVESFEMGNLGLPPDVPVELDDSFIRPFQFITPAISALQKRFADFLNEFGQQPNEPTIEVLEQFFQRLADLRGQLERQAAIVNDDMCNLDARAAERRKTMTPIEEQSFVREVGSLWGTLRLMRQRIELADVKIAQLRGQLAVAPRRQTADRLVQLVTEISRMADEISLIQARARVEAITVQPEAIDAATALNIARANRLDWMNNRAALVDTWRLIEYNANSLQAGLNVVFSGNMSTVGNNPVNFRGTTGSLSAGLQFDAPFTRLLERNNYRQAIIDYQQQRRQLIQFEDSVQEGLRQLLRNLELDKLNLEIQRRAVVIAIRRVDGTREVLNQPPPPPQPGQTAGQLGPTAAQDLLRALSDLSGSQNILTGVWLDYYATAHAVGPRDGRHATGRERPVDRSAVVGGRAVETGRGAAAAAAAGRRCRSTQESAGTSAATGHSARSAATRGAAHYSAAPGRVTARYEALIFARRAQVFFVPSRPIWSRSLASLGWQLYCHPLFPQRGCRRTATPTSSLAAISKD